jgi:hypothetical protein
MDNGRKDYHMSNDLDKLREIVRNMTECPKLRARAMWDMMMQENHG